MTHFLHKKKKNEIQPLSSLGLKAQTERGRGGRTEEEKNTSGLELVLKVEVVNRVTALLGRGGIGASQK